MITFFLFSVFLLFFPVSAQAGAESAPSEKAGCINERMETGEMIDLSGKWQFFYGAFLSANQMNGLQKSQKTYIDVPSNWKGFIYDGEKLPAFGIATYYLKIVPGRNETLKNHGFGIYIGSVAYAYELFINDKLVKHVGHVTESKEGFKAMYSPGSTTFTSNSDTINIVLHVSNFFYPHYSGISRRCYFGNDTQINLLSLKESIYSMFILSILLIFLIIQVIFSRINPQEKSHKYIAWICLAFFVKFAFDSNITVLNLFRNADFGLLYRFWMMTLICTPVLFALAKTRYPAEINKTVLTVVNISYFLIFIFIAFFPLQVVFSYIRSILFLTFLCVLYLLYVFILTIIKKRVHSVVNALSFMIMIATFINDLVFATNQSSFWFISQIGVCIYMMTQSALEFLDYSKSYHNVIELSHELTDINNGLLEIVETKTEHLQTANDELFKINKQQKFLISILSTDLTYIFKKIKTFSTILIKSHNSLDLYCQDLSKIRTASEKGAQIVGNVIDWTYSQTPYNPDKKTITDLSSLVGDLKQFFFDQFENKRIKLQTDIDNNFIFSCDVSHLNIILRNLISNAIKFSYIGSKIEIKNMEEDGKAIIEVTDHGICIPPDKLSTIFNSDKSKKRLGTSGEKGSGIGLLIVNELVKINNGTITCTSEIGIGTTFSIHFNQ
ncbi:MAG: ATP-binding protein [Bacteroidales bacterium]|nr:HAMP domain-containing histidine kinase [Bacteroidales bacterium]